MRSFYPEIAFKYVAKNFLLSEIVEIWKSNTYIILKLYGFL